MMRSVSNRRAVIKAAALGLGACLPWTRHLGVARAQSTGGGAESDGGVRIGVERLRGGITVFSGSGANVVTLAAGDEIVMIDGGLAEHSGALLRAIEAEHAGAAVRALFNTHWHPEQTGANDALGLQGVEIVAHENTRLWLGTDIVRPAEEFHHAALPEHARPTTSFRREGHLRIGDGRVDYRHLPQAHTDGDMYVRFADANVLVVGDLVAVGRYPVPDYMTGGFLPGLVQATQALLDAADEDTLIVPAQGPVQGRAHVAAQLEMLSTLLDRMIDRLYRGFSARDMLDDGVTDGFDEEWGDPTAFVESVYKGMWGHVREFEGIL